MSTEGGARAVSFAPGDRVELTADPPGYGALESGARGVVECVDSLGTIHVRWVSGQRIGILAHLADMLRMDESA